MKRKIKSVAYSVSVLALAAPAVVGAQFEKPGGTGLPESSLYDIIQNIMYYLLMMVGIVGVIGFAIAGILYLTAAGDETRVNKAKSAMLYSIIGVIVALAGLVALNFAEGLLSAQTKF
ncbi:MAG TPA: hypothetical protein PLK35_02455 [Candidatus Moranbacteria bacterium]|nr:hypothetical protein [Candidatus Moranbacteria bacterium]